MTSRVIIEWDKQGAMCSSMTATMVITLGNLARSYSTGLSRIGRVLPFSVPPFASIVEGCVHPLSLVGVGARLNRVGACRLDGAGC